MKKDKRISKHIKLNVQRTTKATKIKENEMEAELGTIKITSAKKQERLIKRKATGNDYS